MESQPDAQLIYEDDELRLVWRRGQSDFALITFSDLVFVPGGLRFFADYPVQKLGMTCLGFVAKRANWYPRQNMIPAIEAVEELLRPFPSRILFGGSMGGYAALKYSALLKASHVLSLCPQWSINKEDFSGGFDPGFQVYFSDKLHNMRIDKEDVRGDVYVMYDKYFTKDKTHCGMLAHNTSGITYISVPRVDHHVTSVLAGTKNLDDLINACRAGNVGDVYAVSRRCRRDSRFRIDRLAALLRRRYGSNYESCLADALVRKPSLLKSRSREIFRVMAELSRRGDKTSIVDLYRKIRHLFTDLQEQKMLCAFCATAADREVLIRTVHGDALCYNIAEDKCVRSNDSGGILVPVQANLAGPDAGLFFPIGRDRFRLAVESRTNLITSKEMTNGGAFVFSAVAGGLFTISFNQKFLGADRRREFIAADRQQAQATEHFYFDIG